MRDDARDLVLLLGGSVVLRGTLANGGSQRATLRGDEVSLELAQRRREAPAVFHERVASIDDLALRPAEVRARFSRKHLRARGLEQVVHVRILRCAPLLELSPVKLLVAVMERFTDEFGPGLLVRRTTAFLPGRFRLRNDKINSPFSVSILRIEYQGFWHRHGTVLNRCWNGADTLLSRCGNSVSTLLAPCLHGAEPNG